MKRTIGFLLLLTGWASGAAAHVTSTGLATLEVDSGKLAYRLTVVTPEVDDQGGRLLAEAADGDRAAAERVAGFLRDYARFSIAGEACQPGRIAIRGSSAGEGKVVLEMALSCPKPAGTLAILDDWPEVLGAHFQTVLSVRLPERPSVEFAFLEDRRSATLDLATAADTGWVSFVAMGVEHILGGVDHLLFLLALLALARGLWQTVTIVTGFTVAHSITLSLAALGVIDVPSRIVEPLIAASIVWVALENLLRTDIPPHRWLLSFCFGLVHGFGFASAIEPLKLPARRLALALLGFNLGVEAGQAFVVVLLLPMLLWMRGSAWEPRIVRAASLGVAAFGLVWLVERLISS